MKRVMNVVALLTLVFASLCVGSGQGEFAHAKETKARRATLHASLQFSLSFEPESRAYTLNDPITVSFSLKNTGKRPVWVNKRFYLAAETLPKEAREVTLTVTGPTGEPLPCTFTSRSGFPKSDYFERLQPGRTVTSDSPRDLRNYFSFSRAGTYTIAGIYENAFGQEIGVDAFNGPIRSKPVAITIVE